MISINGNALLVYSGGMDSTTMLYEYKDKIKVAVSFDYGSKHSGMEFVSAHLHTKKLRLPLERIYLPFIKDYFSSDLLKGQGSIPKGHYEDASMKRTVVPFRNGIMLSIAAGLAESYGLNTLLIANHAGDHVIYPDCRENFINAMKNSIYQGTDKKVLLSAPYTQLTKRQIAMKGIKLGVDYSLTYSCYNGGSIHCGECGTCVERKEALQGFDTTKYLV